MVFDIVHMCVNVLLCVVLKEASVEMELNINKIAFRIITVSTQEQVVLSLNIKYFYSAVSVSVHRHIMVVTAVCVMWQQ